MFTFFGLFADPIVGLSSQVCDVWPELKLIRLERPISAIAGRFDHSRYHSSRDDIPETILIATESLSRSNPTARFLLLRTECWGGACANWGKVIQNGKTMFDAEGDGALRRLIGYWGADIGPREIFEPLTRGFDWG